MNSCCQPTNINDLEHKFDRARAEKEARAYLETGPVKRIQKMLAFFDGGDDQLLSVLDIGCGVGGAHFELLKKGMAREVVGVEASSGYIFWAEQIAKSLDLQECVRYHQLDFAQSQEGVAPADVVILDRVICCYPHLEPLLTPAAERASKYLVLSYPHDIWWVRVYEWGINLVRRMQKSSFFTYIHPHATIHKIAAQHGLNLVFEDRSGSWKISVFERSVI